MESTQLTCQGAQDLVLTVVNWFHDSVSLFEPQFPHVLSEWVWYDDFIGPSYLVIPRAAFWVCLSILLPLAAGLSPGPRPVT